MSPAGKHAIESAPILTRRIDETDPAGGLVWFQFSEAARLALQGSEHYAVLNRAVVLAFESRYSVTLYERGAWLCGRQHDRVWRGTVPQLREILGVPEKAYRNWTELRRNTLDLVPLHSGFDGLSVSGIERGQVGAVHLDGDAPSCAGVA